MKLPDLSGQIHLVTGANAGIGKATARGLARGGAEVIFLCRDEECGRSAIDEIANDTGNDDLHLVLCDLSQQAQIRAAAGEIRDRFDRLDVLVNNAGVYLTDYILTVDQLEKTWAVNHLGYFLLTNLLLDLLKDSSPSRIVNVSSDAHHDANLDFDNLNGEKGYSWYEAYCTSKMANVLFTRELARRLDGDGVTVNAMHPGVVASNIWKRNGDWISRLLRLATPFFRTTEKGAETVLYLAASPQVKGVSGKYFKDCQEKYPARKAQDEELARRLWKVSERQVGGLETPPV